MEEGNDVRRGKGRDGKGETREDEEEGKCRRTDVRGRKMKRKARERWM